jgi:hypothetical protein
VDEEEDTVAALTGACAEPRVAAVYEAIAVEGEKAEVRPGPELDVLPDRLGVVAPNALKKAL